MCSLESLGKFDDALEFVRSLGPCEGFTMLVVLSEIGFEEALQFFA